MKNNLNEKIEYAISYIKNLDFESLEIGKYIVNDDFFYLVQEYHTKKSEDGRFEAHRNYIDIQFLAAGQERIEVTAAAFMKVEVPYNLQNDVVFFKEPRYAGYIDIKENKYAIFYPKDAHKPGVALDQTQSVKKIVGKVRI